MHGLRNLDVARARLEVDQHVAVRRRDTVIAAVDALEQDGRRAADRRGRILPAVRSANAAVVVIGAIGAPAARMREIARPTGEAAVDQEIWRGDGDARAVVVKADGELARRAGFGVAVAVRRR